jgi:hypothetical protein
MMEIAGELEVNLDLNLDHNHDPRIQMKPPAA